jgi:hypothetical protein
LLEGLYQSSWNLVCTSIHTTTWGNLNDVHHKSSHQQYQYYSLSKCWGDILNITWISEPIVMKLGMYVMTSEVIDSALHKSFPLVIQKLQPLRLSR